jgi:hypothetical protein
LPAKNNKKQALRQFGHKSVSKFKIQQIQFQLVWPGAKIIVLSPKIEAESKSGSLLV